MIERGANSDRMTKDEARRIANGIARLPALMGALADDIMKKITGVVKQGKAAAISGSLPEFSVEG